MKIEISNYLSYCERRGARPNPKSIEALKIAAQMPVRPDTRTLEEKGRDILLKATGMNGCELEAFLDCANFLLYEQRKAR